MAAAVAKLNEFRHGRNRFSVDAQSCASTAPTQEQAAKAVNISRRTLSHATKVAKKAPEVLDSVRDGKLSADVAAEVADLPTQTRARHDGGRRDIERTQAGYTSAA